MAKLKSNIFLLLNAGPRPVCNGTNYSDLFECCTEEHQCGLYEGACSTDSQCQGNLKCGIRNCNLTSIITHYPTGQKFDCCYNGMSIRNKTIYSFDLHNFDNYLPHMKSSFLPKHKQKIVRISALFSEGRNPNNFLFVFWEKRWLHEFILKLTDVCTTMKTRWLLWSYTESC